MWSPLPTRQQWVTIALLTALAALVIGVGALAVRRPPTSPTFCAVPATGLYITPPDRGCTYSIGIGEVFIVEPRQGASWPPRLTNPSIVSDPQGMSVSGVNGSNIWAEYRALSPGTVVFSEYGVSVYIHR